MNTPRRPAWYIPALSMSAGLFFIRLLMVPLLATTPTAATAKPEAPPLDSPATAMGVNELHRQGITGRGVTVAVVDSGLAPLGQGKWESQPDGSLWRGGKKESDPFIVFRDFVDPTGENSQDGNGHGTHVVGTIANQRSLDAEKKIQMGVAPDVNLVIARALAADGSGSYRDVIAAIDWIVSQRDRYHIRVLNLSLYAPIGGPYWADPLGQAVMRAWQAGIVVVVAAGNNGDLPSTVTSPGNVPYVITVGAVRSGRFNDDGGDQVAVFSSRGPTESAFAKPDILVPAVRVVAPMPDDSLLATASLAGRLIEKATLDLPVGKTSKNMGYYQLSGTSMAAAEVSGLVALLLQQEPTLSNDQVKYRLMYTARAALTSSGAAAYSIWEQGAGMVQAMAALQSTTTESANVGLDLATDLDPASDIHPWGLTTYDEGSATFTLPPLPTSPIGYLVWNGAGRAWAGATWNGNPDVLAGAGRAWAGAGRAWAGAGRAWAGDAELWAGAGRAWAGAALPTLDSRASTRIVTYGSTLPLIIK